MDINIFISHSSKDKPFVRKIDSALSSNGVEVFLDERNIKVGDSIPDAIYSALSSSTHIIYVISSNSVKSEWVKEELNIAKMQQKENSGLHILPVLIEDIDLPTAVKHIKYASFINWQLSSEFISSMNDIYRSIGITLKYAKNSEIKFYIQYLQEFFEVQRAATELYAVIDTALNAPRGVETYNDNIDSLSPLSTWLVKYMIDNTAIAKMEKFYEYANSYNNWGEETKIGIIIDMLGEFNALPQYHKDYPDCHKIPTDRLRKSRDLLNRIAGSMQEFSLEVSSVIGSNCQLLKN